MPLRAFCIDLDRFVLWDEWDNIPRHKYRCPHCEKPMMAVNCHGKINHFRHKVKCPYHTEPESERHLEMKKIIFEMGMTEGFLARLEHKIGNNVGDVVLDNKYVVECQLSNISQTEVEKRNMNYLNHDFYPIWIWDWDKRMNYKYGGTSSGGYRWYKFKTKLLDRFFGDRDELFYLKGNILYKITIRKYRGQTSFLNAKQTTLKEMFR